MMNFLVIKLFTKLHLIMLYNDLHLFLIILIKVLFDLIMDIISIILKNKEKSLN